MSRHTEQKIAALEVRVAALEDATDPDDLEDAQDAVQADDDGAPDGPYREDRGGSWWDVVDADGNVTKVQGDQTSLDLLESLS